MIDADAGRARAAERQAVLRDVQDRVVDRDAAGLRLALDPIERRAIVLEHIKRERMRARGDVGDRLVERVVRHERQQRPEDFLAA